MFKDLSLADYTEGDYSLSNVSFDMHAKGADTGEFDMVNTFTQEKIALSSNETSFHGKAKAGEQEVSIEVPVSNFEIAFSSIDDQFKKVPLLLEIDESAIKVEPSQGANDAAIRHHAVEQLNARVHEIEN